MNGPVGAVGIQGTGEPVGGEDRPQGGQDRLRPLAALDELREEELLGGVIDDGEERLRGLGHQGQPAMEAAVEVQELPEAGPGLAPPPVPAPRPARADQPRPVQGALDQGVGEGHPVLPPGDLGEVPHIEPLVALPVEPQDALPSVPR
jgi:hypothetical protein